MKFIFYISLTTSTICCSDPASFSNSGPPGLGDETHISFVGHNYGETSPVGLEELEEINLPPASENAIAESVAKPMPITGAPLTCVVSASNETFCKMKDASEPDLTWNVYNAQEERISSDSFEVQTLPSDSFWDIKIIFHEPIEQISIEASNANEDPEFKKPKIKSKVSTVYNFERMLSGSYMSPQWGELDLIVNPDLTVSGSYSINKLKGIVTGTLDLAEASISGTWEERNKRGKLKHSGELIFDVIFEGQEKFYLDGSYINDYDDKWHDWDLFPQDKEKMAVLLD